MPTPRNVALSFLAHPDDAEILCAGTLVRMRDVGWEVHIAAVAMGDCGSTTESAERISARRREEASTAAGLISATYHCLDERDGFLVYDKPTLQKAYDLFRAVVPTLVFTHAPRDYMMDHEIVAQLARAASFLFSAPNISTQPLTASSGVPHLYYCDPLDGIDPLGNPVTPTTVIDITAQMPRKEKMLAAHASQREWLRAHHGMDEYLDAMKRHGAARGKLLGAPYAEAFIQHRGHAYPQNDLLADLLTAEARRTQRKPT